MAHSMSDALSPPFAPRNPSAWNSCGKRAPGFVGWLSTVDHKEIGKRYLVTAFAFLLIGGVEALIMRIQLARPNQTVLTPAEIQPTLHDARRHDDFSLRPADAVRVLELSLAAAARLAGHGVSPPERLLLLGLPMRRAVPLFDLSGRPGAQRRLVQLRAAGRKGIRARG